MTMTRDRRRGDAPVFEYVAHGGVPDAAESYAREKVSRLYRLAPGQVVYARVTVDRLPSRARDSSCEARAVLDAGGRLVRAHVEASDPYEAVDLMQQRLRERLVRLADRGRAQRRRGSHAPSAPAGPEPRDTMPAEPETPAEPAKPGEQPEPEDASPARRRLAAEFDRLFLVRAALWSEGLDTMTETEDISELSGVDQHPADIGTETFERERDLSLLVEIEAEIDAVRRALVHLAQGTYGRCEACGDRIPDDRLAAVPATRLCLADQQRAEDDAARHP